MTPPGYSCTVLYARSVLYFIQNMRNGDIAAVCKSDGQSFVFGVLLLQNDQWVKDRFQKIYKTKWWKPLDLAMVIAATNPMLKEYIAAL